MSGRVRVLVAVAVGTAVAAVVVLATRDASPAAPEDPTQPVGVTNTVDPKVVESYWTDERRRNATGG